MHVVTYTALTLMTLFLINSYPPGVHLPKYSEQSMNHTWKQAGLDVIQSHPLCRTCFSQYQDSSTALGWLGDGDCYLMHKIQLALSIKHVEASWIYSLSAAVLQSLLPQYKKSLSACVVKIQCMYSPNWIQYLRLTLILMVVAFIRPWAMSFCALVLHPDL